MQSVSDFFGSNKGGAASGSSWVLKEKLEFNNEVVDGTSIPIHGNRIDRMMIIGELHDAASNKSICLRLNNDSGNNYTRLYHYGGDIHVGNKNIRDHICLCSCDSGGTGLGRHYLYPEVTGTRRICEGQRQYVRTSYDDNIVNESYFWSNTTDEITSLDFNSDTTAVTGKIYIYEWKDLNVTELHSYELIKEITMDNNVLDESVAIKGNEEDEIKIVSELYDTASSTSICLQLNNDSGNNYTRLYHYGGDIHDGYKNIRDHISLCTCDSGGNGLGRYYLYPKVTGTRRICEGQRQHVRTSNNDHILNESYFWSNTSDEITSLDFNSESIAVTGKIRIYRIAKSHVINRQPLSMDAFLHIQDQKPQGTDGGTFTAGAWQTRDLNTVLTNTISGASLSSNQITLPAGKYYVEAKVPGFFVTQHVAKIYDITNSSDILPGSNERSYNNNASTHSIITGIFEISDTSISIEVQHFCREDSPSNVGFGNGYDFGQGVVNIFTDIRIWRIGDAT